MKRIIIIEDNAVSANLYRGALSREGYRIVVATDGEAGLQAINESRPDLVLLDLMLPKVEGLEVLRQIRATPGLGDLPVIVASNSFTASRLDDVWKAGATQILTKANVPPKDVARIVRETIERIDKR
jgi:CheY-like chemotaxis protein